jgi:virginiamycin B lyase
MTLFHGVGTSPSLSITVGPDGALWFTNPPSDSIGRITTDGVITTFKQRRRIDQPTSIVAGPDGALWFTNAFAGIGRITTAGNVTTYPVSGYLNLAGITAGPDGAIWFTSTDEPAVERITTNVTPTISGFTPPSGAVGTDVTISGLALGGALSVTFHGIVAAIVSNTPNSIVVTVPVGATTGRIAVQTAYGVVTSSSDFVVT